VAAITTSASRRRVPRWTRAHSAGQRLGRVGAIILAFFVLVAVFAPLLAPYDPKAQTGLPYQSPSASHLLGTNDIGQDILSELIYGTRVSLAIGFLAALLAIVVGTLVGVVSGYFGGLVDTLLMRFVDITLALPFLPLLIVLAVFLGRNIRTTVLVISVVIWARPARILRSQVLSARERGFVQAARSMGGRPAHLLRRHVLPAVSPLIIAQFVRAANIAILLEASLSFLGLGDVTAKSWGTTLYYASARGAFLTRAWLWWVLPTGLAISVVVVAFAFIGYSLEERADPRLRARRLPTLAQFGGAPTVATTPVPEEVIP
jgi:ABC-type dipeptide/oligopeptide/nickel transport system permease subunit